MNNWILLGFKGVGKTYFGSKLGLPFVDTDQLIEEKFGQSPRQIVQSSGWEVFRKMEQEVIQSLDIQNHVIALGGGTPLFPKNMEKIQTLGTLIYLKCPKETLRIRFPFENFEQIYSTRIPEYEKMAHVTICLEGKTDHEILEELWQVIDSETSLASPHGANRTEKRSEL